MVDFINRGVATAVILLMAQFSPAWAQEAFGIKGAVPGMTLSEFRSAPYPATKAQRAAGSALYELYCSGDKEKNRDKFYWSGWSKTTGQRPAAVSCSHVEIRSPTEGAMISARGKNHITYAPVGFAGLQATWRRWTDIREVTYHFSPINAGDPRLMLIEVKLYAKKFEHLKNALTRKLGEPQTINQEQVQNRLGAKYQNEVVVWRAGASTVTLRQYTDTLEFGKLEVFHDELKALWVAELLRRQDSTADDF